MSCKCKTQRPAPTKSEASLDVWNFTDCRALKKCAARTRSLLDLCAEHDIEHSRDVFRYYRSDAAAALEAGNDIRTALLCFGLDASHGYERVHLDSLEALARLLVLYMQSKPLFRRDRSAIGPVDDLPTGEPG